LTLLIPHVALKPVMTYVYVHLPCVVSGFLPPREALR